MAQYSTDILGQLGSALEENSLLKVANKKYKHSIKILEHENVRLNARLDSQAKQITELAAQNILQSKLLEKLSDEIDRLRKHINTDSSNSSLPPSQDQKPNIFNSREKSGKKSGGQPGHKGHYLHKSDIENQILQGLMKHKIVHHGQGADYISKYTLDINVEIIATEHRFYGEIPFAFRPDVQYGNSIKTLATLLVGRGIVASNRIVELISNITDNKIQLSDGSIYNWLHEFNAKAQPSIQDIKTNLLNNALLQVDETGTRCERKNMYTRNYSTENHVLYTLNPTKGKQAIQDDNILPRFAGTMMHDHNTVNYNYGTRHAECNVHIDRYLKANSENTKNKWSSELRTLLNSSNTTRKFAIIYGLKEFNKADLNLYQKRYDEILTLGLIENKLTKSRYDKKEELKLLRRLQKYKSNHLLYLEDFTVPFDNNLSERDLRTFKTKTKVSGCFRSLTAGRHFATLLSVIKTAIKQKSSPYYAICGIFAG